jgi:hypothetical protein
MQTLFWDRGLFQKNSGKKDAPKKRHQTARKKVNQDRQTVWVAANVKPAKTGVNLFHLQQLK